MESLVALEPILACIHVGIPDHPLPTSLVVWRWHLERDLPQREYLNHFLRGGRITGRAMAVRVRNSVLDMMCIFLYFPPVPWKKSQHPSYRETIRLIIAWLSEVLDKLPAGTLPALFADVNDGIGKQLAGGSLQNFPTSVVSEAAAGREKLKGGAGESLRILLDLHGISAVSSWSDPRPTFFGNHGNESLLDHIFLPLALLEATWSAGPLMNMAKRLQLIQRKGPADHAPTHACFWYLRRHLDAPPPSSPQVQVCPELATIKWDIDKLMMGVREGRQRREFIAELELVMEKFAEDNAMLLEDATPDRYFTAMDSAIIRCAHGFFGKMHRLLTLREKSLPNNDSNF